MLLGILFMHICYGNSFYSLQCKLNLFHSLCDFNLRLLKSLIMLGLTTLRILDIAYTPSWQTNRKAMFLFYGRLV